MSVSIFYYYFRIVPVKIPAKGREIVFKKFHMSCTERCLWASNNSFHIHFTGQYLDQIENCGDRAIDHMVDITADGMVMMVEVVAMMVDSLLFWKYIKGGLSLKPLKFEHIFIAVITFFSFLLC